MPLGLMLGNGSGTDFQASQRIPMGVAMLAAPLLLLLPLPLGVRIPLNGLIQDRNKCHPESDFLKYAL